MGKLDDMKEYALYALLYDKLGQIEKNLNKLLVSEPNACKTVSDKAFDELGRLKSVQELFNVHK